MINFKESEMKFHQYINHALNYFEHEDTDESDFFARGTHLIFMLKEIQSCCRVYFDDGFFFIFEYKINNLENTDIEELLLKNISFLLESKKIYSHKSNEIILKSEISDDKINEMKKLLVASLNCEIKLLDESKKAIDEIIEVVYFEFKEIIEKIWRILQENFEALDFEETIIASTTEINITKYSIKIHKTTRENCIELADFHLKNNNNKILSSKTHKNWAQKIYIYFKKQVF